MPYPQIATSGDDFTVDTWNDTVSDLEISHVSTLGFSVISGLELSIDAGLSMTVSAGRLQGRKIKDFAEFDENVPASQLSWVWMDDDSGALSYTDDGSNPGGNVVCLGQVDADGTGILGFTEVDRQQLRYTLQELSDSLPTFQASTINSLVGTIDGELCYNTTGKCLMTWNDGLGFWYVLADDSRWSSDAGDGNYTWDIGDPRYVLYATTLTANRTVTLNETDVPIGKKVTVYRTAGGAFTLTCTGVTIPVGHSAEFVYDGADWRPLGSTSTSQFYDSTSKTWQSYDGSNFYVTADDWRWSADKGDANFTWAIGDERYIVYSTALTLGRTVTLGTTNVPKNKRVTVYRTGTGISLITVNGVTLASNFQATFVYNGSAWKTETIAPVA